MIVMDVFGMVEQRWNDKNASTSDGTEIDVTDE
jgi:hypothetical protein